MPGKFVIKKSKGGQFMFNLQATNGRVILTSERYSSKSGAHSGVASVQKNARSAARFEQRASSRGQPYFVLRAPNGEVIGRSEMYSSTSAMKKGIASVISNCGTRRTDDLT